MTEQLRSRLRGVGIQSIEELVAFHTALQGDPGFLAKALLISVAELEALVAGAAALLPDETRAELSAAPPVDEMQTGARDPAELDEETGKGRNVESDGDLRRGGRDATDTGESSGGTA